MDKLEEYFKLARWIAKDLGGAIDRTDKLELEKWLSASDENRKTYGELRDSLAAGENKWLYSEQEVQKHLTRFHQRRSKKYIVMKTWSRYAVALVLLVGLIAFVRWQRGNGEPEDKPLSSIRVAKGDVRLILSTGKEVFLTDTVRLTRVEAVAGIRVTDRGLLYDADSVAGMETEYNELIVPRGGEFHVQLADGSRIWLNAQSELRYPVRFTGARREVYLKGEAYFEVAPDADKPFIVRVDENMGIRVLGTEFNVSAYPADPDIVTTLAKGSVEIMMPEHTVKIVPDEQIVFNKEKNTFERVEVDAAVYSSWKDGNFIFENQSLGMIMERLRRWYEMEVFYTNAEVKEYRFTGDLRKYEDFEKVVRMIEEVAGVKIEINDKCVVIGTK